ncbi:hypothetical protein OHC33_011276, partial [Knufia fluminis]
PKEAGSLPVAGESRPQQDGRGRPKRTAAIKAQVKYPGQKDGRFSGTEKQKKKIKKALKHMNLSEKVALIAMELGGADVVAVQECRDQPQDLPFVLVLVTDSELNSEIGFGSRLVSTFVRLGRKLLNASRAAWIGMVLHRFELA